MKGQLRRKQEREVLAVSINPFFSPLFLCLLQAFMSVTSASFFPQRRIVMLNNEMDRGMEAWSEKREAAKKMEEHKKSLLLKPKGKLLMKKKSQS